MVQGLGAFSSLPLAPIRARRRVIFPIFCRRDKYGMTNAQNKLNLHCNADEAIAYLDNTAADFKAGLITREEALCRVEWFKDNLSNFVKLWVD